MRKFFNRAKTTASEEQEPIAGMVVDSSSILETPEPLLPVTLEEAPVVSGTPDFESEFGNPPVDFVAEFAPDAEAVAVAAPELPLPDEPLELEEWSEPLPTPETPALSDGYVLETPEGRLQIESRTEVRGAENVYSARWETPTDDIENGAPEPVRLREASGAAGERLAREAMWRTHWDAAGRIAMLPRLVTHFKTESASYLATEMPPTGSTLAQFFGAEEARATLEPSENASVAFLSETLLILAQLAVFLVRLHGAGFAHLGLRPDLIVPGKPVQVLDCSFAAPVGEPLEAPLSFAGYSAPELSRPGIVDARSDIYAVGALLYRAVTGADLSESGADFTTWQPRLVMAGVPQLLRRCLGEVETRFASAEELHRALLKLRSRLRPSISYAIAGLSTIGLEATRSTNQDAYGFLSGAWETENGPASWAAFAVADGMGGMAAGEVASEVAVNAFLRAASLWSSDAAVVNQTPPSGAAQAQLVKDWAALANEAVVRALDIRGARGGCTLDAGFIIDRHLSIAHVGDSRLYLLRGGEFELLSRDHSYVMSLLLQGEISFEDLRTHSDRNKVTRSLGERHPQPDYFVDSLQVTKNAPTLELQNGDVLLACSDGLWEPVLEVEMIESVATGDLQSAARQLLKLALQRGAPDNATLVLVRYDEGASPVFA